MRYQYPGGRRESSGQRGPVLVRPDEREAEVEAVQLARGAHQEELVGAGHPEDPLATPVVAQPDSLETQRPPLDPQVDLPVPPRCFRGVHRERRLLGQRHRREREDEKQTGVGGVTHRSCQVCELSERGQTLSRTLAGVPPGARVCYESGQPMPDDSKKAVLRRRWAFAGVLVFFAGVAIAFRSVLLPFMVAGLMAYLMEPIVRRLCARSLRGRPIRRWVAVLAVYVGFFLMLGLVGAYAGPKLGEETRRMIADAPRFLQKVKQEWVPEVNEFLRSLIRQFRSEDSRPGKGLIAPTALAAGWREELREAGLQAWASVRLREPEPGVDLPAARRALGQPTRDAQRGQFLARRLRDGSYSIQILGAAVELEEMGRGRYRVQIHERERPWRKEAGPEIDIEKTLEEKLHAFVDGFGARIFDLLTTGKDLVVGFFSGLGLIALTFVIAAFISIDLEAVDRFALSLVPRGMQPDYEELKGHLDQGLSGVIRGQVLICLINGALTAIGLYFLGVPYAGIWSILAAAMSLIPIFGTILSSAPMIGISLLTTEPVGVVGLEGIGLALAVLAWILFIHFVEANILEPKIVGRHARIHPVLILFALLAGQHVFGIAGLIFAVPVLSIVQTFFLFFKRKLYGDEAGDGVARSDAQGGAP
jgi:predicted PurR-regulated permease PerM